MISRRRRRRDEPAPQNLFFSHVPAARPAAAPDTAPVQSPAPDINDNVLEETPLERISRTARARLTTLQQMALERYGFVPESRFDYTHGAGTVPWDYDPHSPQRL